MSLATRLPIELLHHIFVLGASDPEYGRHFGAKCMRIAKWIQCIVAPILYKIVVIKNAAQMRSFICAVYNDRKRESRRKEPALSSHKSEDDARNEDPKKCTEEATYICGTGEDSEAYLVRRLVQSFVIEDNEEIGDETDELLKNSGPWLKAVIALTYTLDKSVWKEINIPNRLVIHDSESLATFTSEGDGILSITPSLANITRVSDSMDKETDASDSIPDTARATPTGTPVRTRSTPLAFSVQTSAAGEQRGILLFAMPRLVTFSCRTGAFNPRHIDIRCITHLRLTNIKGKPHPFSFGRAIIYVEHIQRHATSLTHLALTISSPPHHIAELIHCVDATTRLHCVVMILAIPISSLLSPVPDDLDERHNHTVPPNPFNTHDTNYPSVYDNEEELAEGMKLMKTKTPKLVIWEMKPETQLLYNGATSEALWAQAEKELAEPGRSAEEYERLVNLHG